MFQRFKEASSSLSNFVDQLADEQGRLRTQQTGQRGSNGGRGGTRGSRNTTPSRPKPQRNSTDDTDRPTDLNGPDPDPANFEVQDTAPEKDGVKQEQTTPQPSETPEAELPAAQTNGETSAVVPAVNDAEKIEDAEAAPNDVTGPPPTTADTLPDEVQLKLKKLGKLETKYQDLLKAYKRAHARNAAIEPFEARLRENTPLTSITDPGSLVDYLNQLSVKGDMVMQELKKVSSEKDDLKHKLDEAEQKTRDAYDEISKLKEQQSSDQRNEGLTEEGTHDTTKATSPIPEEENSTEKEMFSVEAEVPRLEAELQRRSEEITQLQTENLDLKQNLSVANESAEQMMRDMQTAREELESIQGLHSQIKEENTQVRTELETKVVDLESRLKATQDDLASVRDSNDASREEHEEREKRQEALQQQVNDLTSQLEVSQTDLSTLQSKHEEIDKSHQQESSKLQTNIINLQSELQTTNTEMNVQSKKLAIAEATLKQLRSRPSTPARPSTPQTQSETVPIQPTLPATTAAKKKNNKKKNKKKGSTAAETGDVEESGPVDVDTAKATEETTLDDAYADLQNRFDDCIAQLVDKDAMIEQLEKKLRVQSDLLEEIEGLRDDLLNIGQEHVEVKNQLLAAEKDRQTLQQRKTELEEQIAGMTESQQTNSAGTEEALAALREELEQSKTQIADTEAARIALQGQVEKLEQEMSEREKERLNTVTTSTETQRKLEADFEDLRSKSRSLQTNLSAAEQLAATRFKEMTSLRDMLQKAQPELSSLRAEVGELRTTREELATKSKDLRRLELREDSLRLELDSLKKDVSMREQDINNLNQKLSQETSQRLAAEETDRKSSRDLQRIQQEMGDVTDARDTLAKELENANKHLSESRSKLDQLQREVDKLNSDTDGLRDEIQLKSAQHASAELLMTSVRDSASEMAVQLKEAKERCESLEEELTDIHRLMGERGRENETMRRLLADVETRAESRIKEMRERMEVAVQERDRAEEDASMIGRRKTRELDDIKNKLRRLEHDLKRSLEDKEELQLAEGDLRHKNNDIERRLEHSKVETEELRRAMGELRDALDDGEKQARDFEVERNALKQSITDVQQQVERLQKSNKTLSDELRSARATRMRPTDSPTVSTRSSLESSRPGRITSPTSPLPARVPSFALAQNAGIDYVYLKNVLLQFLEQKDKNHQKQLVPVLGMLLHFDKKDEAKWMTAINSKA